MDDHAYGFLTYLQSERRRYALRYRAAQFVVERAYARRQVLHFGSLIRQYGGRA